jgi:hypothetical protein
MAHTVQAAFNQFFNEINLTGDHRTIANSRRDHLIELLGNKFHVIEAFPSGSIPRYTALHGHADLDIMLVLHYGKHVRGKKPSEVLQAVRDAIGYKTTVRKNGQAVTLHYTTFPKVDIVPVYYVRNGDNSPQYYCVPDANTETWIDSNPKDHSTAIQGKVTECGDNFRKIIKIAKHWNKSHSDYLQSYHIEVLAQRVLEGPLLDLPWNVFLFFEKSIPLLNSALWHEWGFADHYLSHSDRQEAMKRVVSARDAARTAWYHTYGDKNDHAAAITYWRQVFGDKFPTYG